MLAALAGPVGPTMTRRRLLATAGATAVVWWLAGCTGDDGPGPNPSETASPTPPPDPDAGLRAAVLKTAEALAAGYLATAVAHPGLTAELSPLLADHRAHIAALSPTPAPTTPAPSVGVGSSAPVEPTAPTPSGAPVPTDPEEARGALRDGESTAADVARNGAVSAADPALARLFASISASRSLHAATLDT